MSLAKRMRAALAVFTQDVQTFRCACGAESLVVGKAFAITPDGAKCDDCESAECEKWIEAYEARMARAFSGEAA